MFFYVFQDNYFPFTMKNEYNSRQRKIYNDYNAFGNEKLLEITQNSKKYFPEVIGVIKDILVERNVILPSADHFASDIRKDESSGLKREAHIIEERKKSEAAERKFIKELNEKPESELTGIITRYTSYELETVKAALTVSVEKGFISYDTKENLLTQIETNRAMHGKSIEKNKWESENAFVGYVSGYQDDVLYNIIEDPHGIVIDVYHAILVTALQRELISNEDFREYFAGAKKSLRSDEEKREEVLDEFIGNFIPPDIPVSEEELETETAKYWKCPSCNENVGMEFGICWNCQAEMPEVVEHPGKEEVRKEIAVRKPFSPVKTGISLIALGLLFGVIDYLVLSFHHHYISSGIVVLIGLGFVIFGLFFYKKP
jgi:hypothetical protein